jgi:hypothetical protein
MSAPQKKFVIPFISIIVILFAIPTVKDVRSAPVKELQDMGENHALIIGINNYEEWSKLKSPVKDAEEMAKILSIKYNFKKQNIVLLTDNTKEKPTLGNVLANLNKYLDTMTAKDNLLVYFSGHGAEDDQGETYWVPINGKKNVKMTWIKHSDLCKEIFASEKFKVKNLCILTDSVFSNNLIRSKSTSLTPYDLRYSEKITEKAKINSREVISFDNDHWPGDSKTGGLGLFTYYVSKALSENPLEVIDFENLVFDDNVLFPIRKKAGTNMLRGRLKTPAEKGGQFVIARLMPSVAVDVVMTNVEPEKGYPGDIFNIKAKTSSIAKEVYVEIDGQKQPMQGRGTEWEFNANIGKTGTSQYKVTAVNDKDAEGKAQTGQIVTVKKTAEKANVMEAAVEPKTGALGDDFTFKASTDKPAKGVTLILKGKPFEMTGSGTQWLLSRKMDISGNVDFSTIATNKDGIPGSVKGGVFTVKSAIANVVDVSTDPKTGLAGEEFLITATTDRPASTVSIQIDGATLPMTGSGNTWQFKRKVPDAGKKPFTVLAKNTEGAAGLSKTGEIITRKTAVIIPDVASVDINVVAPGKGYPGDSFMIKAKTSAPSESVVVEIENERHAMQGSGTDWSYLARINKLGPSKYRVIAKGKEGQGQSKEGEIFTVKEAAAPVNIITASVSPEEGYIGKQFIFKASTDKPAKGVTIVLGNERIPMTGSDTNWQLAKNIEKSGTIPFTMIPRNKDDVEGGIKTASLIVQEKGFKYNPDGTITDLVTGKVQKRFVDNKDGTITDLLTNVMWMKEPKTVALTWDEAVEYCQNLEVKGQTGWRLPTIAEIEKLIDVKQQNPALPPGHPFSNVITHVGYWTKTKHKFGPQYVFQMNLWYGKSEHKKKSENSIVWPVRYVE